MTIKQKQCLLLYLGCYTGAVDGVWGNNSRGATEAFQRNYGLTVDGIPGAATQKMLIGAIAGTAVKVDKPISSTPQKTGAFWDGIKYFKREEFRCPCGKCGGFPVEPKEALVKQLVSIREHFNAPITIVPLPPANAHSGGSGVRCQEYNDSLLGSVKNSRHVQGKAADIIVSGFSGISVKAYCDSLVKAGKLRYCYVIGGGNSVHVDIL